LLSRLASPSDLGDSAPVAALSPLAGLGGLGRFRRGELIHRLLQILPDLDSASWDRAARRLLEKEAGLTSDQVSEMTAAALGVLQHPEFAFLFGPGSRAEAGIVGGAAAFPEGLRLSENTFSTPGLDGLLDDESAPAILSGSLGGTSQVEPGRRAMEG
jgi:ATP-dependent helicase/nuclease subunit A